MLLTERQGKILASVVYEYTKSGTPVSSSLIASKHYPEVSSATIRNEMLDLEEKGFLIKPHISAGRIPSDKGLRYFVDNFLQLRELSWKEQKKLELEMIKMQAQNARLSHSVAKLLSLASQCLALSGLVDRKEFYDFGMHTLLRDENFKQLDELSKISAALDFLDLKIDKLTKAIGNEEVKIFIGDENPIEEMRQCSMIASPYLLKSGERGILAIIGSKRMKYGRNRNLVDFMKKLIKKKEKFFKKDEL